MARRSFSTDHLGGGPNGRVLDRGIAAGSSVSRHRWRDAEMVARRLAIVAYVLLSLALFAVASWGLWR